MKVVTVHRGARDGYQVARALSEAGLLDTLVTELFWPSHSSSARQLEQFLPAPVVRLLKARSEAGIRDEQVEVLWSSGLASTIVERLRQAPFFWKQQMIRWSDRKLGEYAGRLARRRGCALLSYSYYGYSAFSCLDGSSVPRMLFQLHPHPASIRRILEIERERFPECAASLNKEWELALPEEEFQQLVEEVSMAEHWLAASTFTRRTLEENGVPAERIQVIPYGVKAEVFRPLPKENRSGPLKLLFVGTMNQRKGIRYLIDSLALLPKGSVELTMCGRVVDDLTIVRHAGQTVHVRPNVSHQELLEAYNAADLFVFPSVAEGFAHVILEALACGLPVLSTTRTAALDVVSEGTDGFVVEPCSAAAIGERIQWCLDHRGELADMRQAARAKALQFSWHRFRTQTADAVNGILALDRKMASRESIPA